MKGNVIMKEEQCNENTAETVESMQVFDIEKIKKFQKIYNEQRDLKNKLEKHQEENAEEMARLEKEIISMFEANEVPNFSTDGCMTYMHSRPIIGYVDVDPNPDPEANPDKLEIVKEAISSKLEEIDSDNTLSDEEKEYQKNSLIYEYMNMGIKEMAVRIMKEDEELSMFISESFNTAQMTSFLHRMNDEYGFIPASLRPLFKLDNITTLRVKSNQKSKSMKSGKNKNGNGGE